jgi:hypothetical protein
VLAVATNRPVDAIVSAQLEPGGGRGRLVSRRSRASTDAAVHRHAVPLTDVIVLNQWLPLQLAKRSPCRRELGRSATRPERQRPRGPRSLPHRPDRLQQPCTAPGDTPLSWRSSHLVGATRDADPLAEEQQRRRECWYSITAAVSESASRLTPDRAAGSEQLWTSSISQLSLTARDVAAFVPMEKSRSATGHPAPAVAMPARASMSSTRPCGVPRSLRSGSVFGPGGRSSSTRGRRGGRASASPGASLTVARKRPGGRRSLRWLSPRRSGSNLVVEVCRVLEVVHQEPRKAGIPRQLLECLRR